MITGMNTFSDDVPKEWQHFLVEVGVDLITMILKNKPAALSRGKTKQMYTRMVALARL